METERVIEFPIVNMDKCPRKRQRLVGTCHRYAHVFLWPRGWEHDKCYALDLSLDIANRINMFSHGLPNVTPRSDSPPWRKDDKDGHYSFAIGDNLTPRYKIQNKMGEGTFGQVLECWDRESTWS